MEWKLGLGRDSPLFLICPYVSIAEAKSHSTYIGYYIMLCQEE